MRGGGAGQQAVACAPVRLAVRLPEEGLAAQEHAAAAEAGGALRAVEQPLRATVTRGILQRGWGRDDVSAWPAASPQTHNTDDDLRVLRHSQLCLLQRTEGLPTEGASAWNAM